MVATINKTWRDPVGSKLIAALILAVIAYLISIIKNINLDSYSAWILIVVLILIASIIIVFVNLHRKHKKSKRLKALQLTKLNSETFPLEELNKDFPNVDKLGVIGLSGAGKTTFIENICNVKNNNKVTQGDYIYIKRFNDKYCALLDGSGQNQSAQNDIAITADILIIFIDHNKSSTVNQTDNQRITEHETFLRLIRERLSRNNKSPNYIHIFMNKIDLWQNSHPDEKRSIENFLLKEKKRFKRKFKKSQISYSFHSNLITEYRTKAINILSNKIT